MLEGRFLEIFFIYFKILAIYVFILDQIIVKKTIEWL